MKKVILLAAMILAVDPLIDPVHAADRDENTYCASTGIADGGFVLNVNSNGRTAVLAEQSFTGPRNQVHLVCTPGTIRTFPDALNNYLNCKIPRNVGGGLIVRMFAGGIGGFHYASVRAVTMLRGKVVEREVNYGRLNCRNE